MLELYIENKLVDLDDSVNIAFSYKQLDLDNPTATKSSFSKTVELKGTNNNNTIFGEFWKLDRNIINNGTIGASFDPKKRVNFKLLSNGALLESGYLSLDNVKNVKGEITYSVTLYGGLGDFFYNLMYNDTTGKERTLYDLYYGLKTDNGEVLTEEQENNQTLMIWDKHYIKNCWDRLNRNQTKDNNLIIDNIIPVTTYSGYYDDFDSSKFLVNYNSFDTVCTNVFNVSQLNDGDKIARPYPDSLDSRYTWVIGESSRDLDEYEARDLRSRYQRYSIKTSLILNAISNPKNNGGYEVIWDDEIKESDFYNKSYIMFPRINFDEDENANNIIDFSYTPEVFMYNKVTRTMGTFNTSSMNNPKVEMNLQIQLQSNVKTKIDNPTLNYIFGENYGVLGGIYLNITSNTGIDTKAFLTTDDFLKMPLNAQEELVKKACTTIGITTDEFNIVFINLTADDVELGEQGAVYQFKTPVNVKYSGLPSQSNVTFNISMQYVSVINVDTDKVFNTLADRDYKTVSYIVNGLIDLYSGDEEYLTNGLYDGSISPKVQPTNVNKRILLGGSDSPYDYLIGFGKMLGLKFEIETGNKKVYIKQRKNYYKNIVEDISDKICYDKGITIKPTLTEYKWYEYGLNVPETYASKLYKNRNNSEYGSVKIDTNYYFNNEVNNLYEDVIYTSAIPYRLQSIFFNDETSVPPVLLSPTADMTAYDSKTIDELSKTIKAYSRKVKYLNSKKDSFDKLCCFDSSNNEVDDLRNSLIFYNGYEYKNTNGAFVLSDNADIMFKLNGNACYFNTCHTDDTTTYDYNYMMIGGKYLIIDDRNDLVTTSNPTGYCTFCFDYIDGEKFYLYSKMESFATKKYLDYSVNSNLRYTGTGRAIFRFNEVGELQCWHNERWRCLRTRETYLEPYDGNESAVTFKVNTSPTYWYQLRHIPKFSKYVVNGDNIEASLDFSKPNYTFLDNINYDESITIYNKYWKNYITDVYDSDAKSVTLYVFLDGMPKDKLKRFYFFENSIWLLNEITDYNCESRDPVKCTFIKVNNKNNYLT